MSGFDSATPNIARVYDFLLGGKDNFESDRQMAARLLEIYPPVAHTLWTNRRFVASAVEKVASLGVRQYVDLGAGFPTEPNIHQTVTAVHPEAKIAYVDYDPVVISHLNSLVANHDRRIAVIEGDVRTPAAVLEAVRAGGIDFGSPVCVTMALVLHFIDATTAAAIAREYREALAPGSYMIITIGRGDGEIADQFNAQYNAAISASGSHLYNHSVAEFASFFGDLEIMAPGFADAADWLPDTGGGVVRTDHDPVVGHAFVGVGRVPAR